MDSTFNKRVFEAERRLYALERRYGVSTRQQDRLRGFWSGGIIPGGSEVEPPTRPNTACCEGFDIPLFLRYVYFGGDAGPLGPWDTILAWDAGIERWKGTFTTTHANCSPDPDLGGFCGFPIETRPVAVYSELYCVKVGDVGQWRMARSDKICDFGIGTYQVTNAPGDYNRTVDSSFTPGIQCSPFKLTLTPNTFIQDPSI